jgi:hypothetical protein
VPYSNVLSLQSQLASTEATLPPLEEKIDQAADLLAALSGDARDWNQPPLALSDLHLPGGAASQSAVAARPAAPDVLIAEAELHAANASIGVATAAMLPNLTLSAGLGVEQHDRRQSLRLSEPVLEPRCGPDAADLSRWRAVLPAQGGRSTRATRWPPSTGRPCSAPSSRLQTRCVG